MIRSRQLEVDITTANVAFDLRGGAADAQGGDAGQSARKLATIARRSGAALARCVQPGGRQPRVACTVGQWSRVSRRARRAGGGEPSSHAAFRPHVQPHEPRISPIGHGPLGLVGRVAPDRSPTCGRHYRLGLARLRGVSDGNWRSHRHRVWRGWGLRCQGSCISDRRGMLKQRMTPTVLKLARWMG